jgi:hypothetical protein
MFPILRKFLILREPRVLVLTSRAFYDRNGENGVPTLTTAVRAVAIYRPLGDDPRTGVRERGHLL